MLMNRLILLFHEFSFELRSLNSRIGPYKFSKYVTLPVRPGEYAYSPRLSVDYNKKWIECIFLTPNVSLFLGKRLNCNQQVLSIAPPVRCGRCRNGRAWSRRRDSCNCAPKNGRHDNMKRSRPQVQAGNIDLALAEFGSALHRRCQWAKIPVRRTTTRH